MLTLTAGHLQVIGVAVVVLIGLVFLWWLVRNTIARPKRGRTAYWLVRRDDDDEDGGEIHLK